MNQPLKARLATLLLLLSGMALSVSVVEQHHKPSAKAKWRITKRVKHERKRKRTRTNQWNRSLQETTSSYVVDSQPVDVSVSSNTRIRLSRRYSRSRPAEYPSWWRSYIDLWNSDVLRDCSWFLTGATYAADPVTGDKCPGRVDDYYCALGEQTCHSLEVPMSATHPTKRCTCKVEENRTFECMDWDPCSREEDFILACPIEAPLGERAPPGKCGKELSCSYGEEKCCDENLIGEPISIFNCHCAENELFDCQAVGREIGCEGNSCFASYFSPELTDALTPTPSRAPTNRPSSSPSFLDVVQGSPPSGEAALRFPTALPQSLLGPTIPPLDQREQTDQPFLVSTGSPTERPTTPPSKSPTSLPSQGPTMLPTTQPSSTPTAEPTSDPTRSPSGSPSMLPSNSPTEAPSHDPTVGPTMSPSLGPSKSPSSSPSNSPTVQPSVEPTSSPTRDPSPAPTIVPTGDPTPAPSTSPTTRPTREPSLHPTKPPSQQPTGSQTDQQELAPSVMTPKNVSPTPSPTKSPTRRPTRQPTGAPTLKPTLHPTTEPTARPTHSPTFAPTETPSARPTDSPTSAPTHVPSSQPTKEPTGIPTKPPTKPPSISPSSRPSATPSASPTSPPPSTSPSAWPTFVPTGGPTVSTGTPTTASPSDRPSWSPSSPPSAQPTKTPVTVSPTGTPTSGPSSYPTPGPTDKPTGEPTFLPTMTPTYPPSQQPTYAPSAVPTELPEPSFSPSSMTVDPSPGPSAHPTTLEPTFPPTPPAVESISCDVTTVDFEVAGDGSSLDRGAYVSTEWVNLGVRISATPRAGTGFAPDGKARLYDTSDPNGLDPDLGTPSIHCESNRGPGKTRKNSEVAGRTNCEALGNVLIIQQEDGEPNDSRDGGSLTFSFDAGPANSLRMRLLDVALVTTEISVTNDDGKQETYDFQGLGDNAVQTVVLNDAHDVRELSLNLESSGAVASISFCSIDVPPTMAPSPSPPRLRDVKDCTRESKCGLCEGNCNRNSDCEFGMVCYRPYLFTPVPGCEGMGTIGNGYCYFPDSPPPLSFVGNCEDEVCGICEGDCDHDRECEPGLRCEEYTPGVDIPGCSGYGVSNLEYCARPFLNVSRDCWYEGNCRACEGDCNHDSDCPEGLLCYQREDERELHVPGCYGTTAGDTVDFCYAPTPDEGPPLTYLKECGPGECGECEGDCDGNSHCAEGLLCYKRRGYERVPGCAGFGFMGSDYCYKPSPKEGSFPNEITHLGDTACTPQNPCDECVGGCTNDADCDSHFVCVQRSGNEPIPGCVTGGDDDVADATYCMEPLPNGPVTYIPGKLNVEYDGLVLSEGLTARRVATGGLHVELSSGQVSSQKFHRRPDAAGVFPRAGGGWYYVSNSEVLGGGVGSIEFNSDGDVVGYEWIANGTDLNCGGAKTWWGTWLTCEETFGGQVYEVSPNNTFAKRLTILGDIDGGYFESAAYDRTDITRPTFYVSEDYHWGALRRFTPRSDVVTETNSCDCNYTRLLTEGGGDSKLEYLLLDPEPDNLNRGTFRWSTDLASAREDAAWYYSHSEGLDVQRGKLYLTAKSPKVLLVLNLRTGTYERTSTVSGAFEQEPDQVRYLLGSTPEEDLLYFCEDGLIDSGVHARDREGNFYSILDGPGHIGETSGLDFDPQFRTMYISYQEPGIVYAITREDGYPFGGTRLDIKYHTF